MMRSGHLRFLEKSDNLELYAVKGRRPRRPSDRGILPPVCAGLLDLCAEITDSPKRRAKPDLG